MYPDWTSLTSHSANALVVVICVFLTILFRRRNRLADEGKMIIDAEDPSFRYTL
jgi:hypothetical protein